jgi:hypothetical protein
MLRELLSLIAAGGSATRESMARSLGIQTAEVEGMLAQLRSLGYIEELSTACSACADGEGKRRSGCSSCAMCPMGNSASQAHVWALSEKGRKALKAEGSAQPSAGAGAPADGLS